ncbi:peptide deformylase [Arthrobacter sp. JSM 101049]|uniref:peptide deformylase n=1 Tax=Arthrobacter sp. JSM 101049 TaxID=929097 RepID=UPI0035640678
MTILEIRIVGDPVLRTPASEVTTFGPELARLVEDMAETMDAVDGAGLAAPQVGVGLRVFTYRVDGYEGHVVNPVLEVGSQDDAAASEGCLSVPGLGYPLPRANWARVTGMDVTGEPLTVEGEGMLARCLQHETDHLDGRLYIDRLRGADKKDALGKIRALGYNDVAHRTRSSRAISVGSSFGGGIHGAGL